jgi:acetamidase/formamidase
MRPLHNTYSLKNTIKIDIFKTQIMERPIAECLDFEELVGRSDAVYKSTRGATTDQKLKRKIFCSGLIILNKKITVHGINYLFFKGINTILLLHFLPHC